jgi:hypothetical protein
MGWRARWGKQGRSDGDIRNDSRDTTVHGAPLELVGLTTPCSNARVAAWLVGGEGGGEGDAGLVPLDRP